MKNERKEDVRKNLDLARELDMVTEITILAGELGTVLKDLEKKLVELETRVRIKAVESTAFFRSTRILRRVQET